VGLVSEEVSGGSELDRLILSIMVLPFHLQQSQSQSQPQSQSDHPNILPEVRAPLRGPSPSQSRGRGHNAPPVAITPESALVPTTTYAHRRSTSLSGMHQGGGNLNVNRWSKSTASSAASAQSPSQKTTSSRRMSVGVSGSFFLTGADCTSPEKQKQSRSPAATAYASSSTRTLASTLTLPPIVTVPNLQTSARKGSSPLIGPGTPSPSTAGLLSAAVRTTVPDYFGRTWEDSTPRAFTANADPTSVTRIEDGTSRPLADQEEKRKASGHSRHRSQAGKSSASTNGSTKASKGPSQKAMLSKALQKANTAVLLDNAQNFEGAMQAYSEACGLLQQVMARSSGNEDRRKLEAIVSSGSTLISWCFANRLSAIHIPAA
jgi:hypothetical protein